MAEIKFATKEEAPEQMRSLLKESGDGFIFRFETPERLAEFRENNTRLLGERDQLAEQLKGFDGLDAEAARAALERLRLIDEKQLVDAGKLDEVVAQRTKSIHETYEQKLGKLNETLADREERIAAMSQERNSRFVEDRIREVADRIGLRSKAVKFATQEALRVFAVEGDGEERALVARDATGARRQTKDGRGYLDVESWLSEMREGPADFWFEQSAGGGAAGNDKDPAPKGTKSVHVTDARGMSNNLESIAAGETVVRH